MRLAIRVLGFWSFNMSICSPLGVHFIMGLLSLSEDTDGIVCSAARTWAASIALGARSVWLFGFAMPISFFVWYIPWISLDDNDRKLCIRACGRHLSASDRKMVLIVGQPWLCMCVVDGGRWMEKRRYRVYEGKRKV
jgi:hypothetical protein